MQLYYHDKSIEQHQLNLTALTNKIRYKHIKLHCKAGLYIKAKELANQWFQCDNAQFSSTSTKTLISDSAEEAEDKKFYLLKLIDYVRGMNDISNELNMTPE